MKISIENVSHIYMPGTPFEKHALKNINLEIETGEFIGLIGHTGCGKSTLVQHLNGLLKPTSGKIYADGKDIWSKGFDMRALRFGVGLVFQYPEYQLFEETVFEDVAFGPKNMGLSEMEVKKRVKSALSCVGIGEATALKSPFEISGGQKRRVAIAGVLSMSPKVLVLDEPAAGLDPKGRREILDNIKRLHAENEMTVIIVSHSMEDIAKTVSRVVVMNEGEIHMQGSVDEVFGRGECLSQIGLDVPQITLLAKKLREAGYPISDKIYTVEQAKRELLALFSK